MELLILAAALALGLGGSRKRKDPIVTSWAGDVPAVDEESDAPTSAPAPSPVRMMFVSAGPDEWGDWSPTFGPAKRVELELGALAPGVYEVRVAGYTTTGTALCVDYAARFRVTSDAVLVMREKKRSRIAPSQTTLRTCGAGDLSGMVSINGRTWSGVNQPKTSKIANAYVFDLLSIGVSPVLQFRCAADWRQRWDFGVRVERIAS